MRFYIITIVWGEVYTDLFLRFALPTQLSAGNLPAFRQVEKAVYAIYTTSKDAETIRTSSVYSALYDIVYPEIVEIDDIDLNQNKMVVWNECQKRAILAGNRDNSILIFLSPDDLWADGSFSNLLKIAASGKKVVLVNTVNLTKETFVPAFVQEFTPNKDLSISVTPRELVRLSLDHLHPLYKAWTWDSKDYCYPPYSPHIYWKVNQEGLLGKGFHIHPLLVNPARKDVVPSHAVDVDYIHSACPNIKDIYVVEDSDEILYCGLRFYEQNIKDIKPYDVKNGRNVWNIALLAANISKVLYYHHVFRYNTRIHQCEFSPEWEKIEKEANWMGQKIGYLLPILVVYVKLKFKMIIIYAYLKKAMLILTGEEKIQKTNIYQKLITKISRGN